MQDFWFCNPAIQTKFLLGTENCTVLKLSIKFFLLCEHE